MSKLISLRNATYQIPYADTLLEGINLEVHVGDFLGILGPNGAGKTTIMDIFMGFRELASGQIEVLGENPFQLERVKRREISFLSQDIAHMAGLSVRDFLDFHTAFFPNHSVSFERELIERMKIDPDKKIGSLSLGQQKKVQIISGLSVRPKLLLIDEITAVLDPNSRQVFFEMLQEYRKERPCAILLATNIMEELVENVDKILFLKDKKLFPHDPKEIGALFSLRRAA